MGAWIPSLLNVTTLVAESKSVIKYNLPVVAHTMAYAYGVKTSVPVYVIVEIVLKGPVLVRVWLIKSVSYTHLPSPRD